MKKRDYLNTLINHVVFTLDTLFKDKTSSQDLLNYLYLITTGMILTYGENQIENIYNTISNVKYHHDTKRIEINNQLFYKNPTNHNYNSKTLNFNNLKYLDFNYELHFETIDSSNIKTLEYLTHELNYILFSKKRYTSIKDNISIRFNYLTNKIIPINLPTIQDQTIDKVFNVLQVEDIIKEILLLRDKKINNSKFKKALKAFDTINYNTYKVEGLDILTNLLRPLYNINDIKKLVNSSSSKKSLEKEIDDVLGKNSYKEICKKIESLCNLISNSNKNSNYYYLSLEYVSIQNNYINKYIHIKYA